MAKEALIPAAVLITGASSGIGEALAREYAAPGRFLALCGQNKERLKNVAMACRSFGAEVEAKIVDVMDRDATRHWIKKIDAGHPLDLVIANAGRREYVNNSRIIAPNGQGPEEALARATRKEQLLVADIEFNSNGNSPAGAARKNPWLFRELGKEMIRAAGGH